MQEFFVAVNGRPSPVRVTDTVVPDFVATDEEGMKTGVSGLTVSTATVKLEEGSPSFLAKSVRVA